MSRGTGALGRGARRRGQRPRSAFKPCASSSTSLQLPLNSLIKLRFAASCSSTLCEVRSIGCSLSTVDRLGRSLAPLAAVCPAKAFKSVDNFYTCSFLCPSQSAAWPGFNSSIKIQNGFKVLIIRFFPSLPGKPPLSGREFRHVSCFSFVGDNLLINCMPLNKPPQWRFRRCIPKIRNPSASALYALQ